MQRTQPLTKMPPTSELWRLHLQRRVLRLLSQHERQLFSGKFRAFFAESTLPRLPLLQQYDRYLKLLLLSEELRHDILPRIRRQLSLQETLVYRQEDAPTQGEIDWSRTVQQTMRNLPDQPPLRFETRQHQRRFESPENLLVAALLLHYQQTVKAVLLEDLADEALTTQERQMLGDSQEHIERELVTFRSLQDEAQRTDIETLVEQVRLHLRPGISPYRDLISWWEQFHELHIHHVSTAFPLQRRRSDEQQDTWLYELWLMLELLNLLVQQHALDTTSLQISTDSISYLFTWQDRCFHLHYHRQSSTSAHPIEGWQAAPVISAACRIERAEPLTIEAQGKRIWQEPSFLISASFFSPEMQPIRRPLNELCGDMHLLGATQSVLCLPILPATTVESEQSEQQRSIAPALNFYHPSRTRETHVALYALPPGIELAALHTSFQGVLDLAAQSLPERLPVACHGVHLDKETINASRSSQAPYDMLCPKPHIGKGVFDLVNEQQHCMKDAFYCHVIGQRIIPPFVIRATSFDALTQQSTNVRTQSDSMLRQAENVGDEARAEQLRSHIFLGVGRAIEQYVQVRGNTANIEAHYEEWIFGQYWKQHARSLAKETRAMLLSAAYVWDEYQRTALDDWAAPAIQYCRALEAEIKRRLHDYYPDAAKQGFIVPRNEMTLGALEFIYLNQRKNLHQAKSKDVQKIQEAQYNWQLCISLVRQSGTKEDEFTATIDLMFKAHVANMRNQLAHGGPIPKDVAQTLRDAIIGRRDTPGMLPWFAEHLQPKQ